MPPRRVLPFLAALATFLPPSPAYACETDGPHRFDVPSLQRPSLRSNARVTAEVTRRSSFPLAPCALQSSVIFRVKGVPSDGTWGILVTARNGTAIPVPEWPMKLAPDGTATVSWRDSLGLWRGEVDALLEASLVDARGRQSTPRPVRASASGSPQVLGWALVVALVGLIAWGGRRSRH